MVTPSASCPSTSTRPTADGVTDKPSTASTHIPSDVHYPGGHYLHAPIPAHRALGSIGGWQGRNELCRMKVLQTLACHICRVSRRLDRSRANRRSGRKGQP